jgi:hypothetical protein
MIDKGQDNVSDCLTFLIKNREVKKVPTTKGRVFFLLENYC